MTLRVQVQELVSQGDIDRLGEVVADEPRAIRHLVGCTYQEDEQIRQTACQAIGRAARHHPDLVQQVVRRLIWAMNDESGTNSLTAPAVIKAVADTSPELLLPVVPDLTAALYDEAQPVRYFAAAALGKLGVNLKALWWVVPRVYWKEIAGLLLLLAAWFALMARFPRHRPTSNPKHLALMALTAVVPMALACSAVAYAITRDWAQGFLPDAVTLVPFPG